eukprot:jgi/Astpho2/1375/Aster-06232
MGCKRKQQGFSDLREPGRHVAIVTTASLPWMTGTAVNPTLRAAYLSRNPQMQVTLVLPWLNEAEQDIVYPEGVRFQQPADQLEPVDMQEAHVRKWVQDRVDFETPFHICFYTGSYSDTFCSIMPVGDLTDIIPDEEADVAILEEPEHLTWFHHGRRWSEKFNHVIGVAHTNYVDYVRRECGPLYTRALALMNKRLCSIHCHKVIKLSEAVQKLPRETTAFVHGVAQQFLTVGDQKAQQLRAGEEPFTKGAYFIGKGVWGKGYTELLDLLHEQRARGESSKSLDVYGNGEDIPEIKERAQEYWLDIQFHPGTDHVNLGEHQVLANPSTSDVVATTSCEALAMGKWVVCAQHPSNRFFLTFANCLTYSSPEEFSRQLRHAEENKPSPLAAEDWHQLTWEAATERFLDVASIQPDEWPSRPVKAQNLVFWRLYNTGIGAPSFSSLPCPARFLSWVQMGKAGQVFLVCSQHAVTAGLWVQ